MAHITNWEQKLSPTLRQAGITKPDSYCHVIVELSGNGTDEIMSIINMNKGKLCRESKIICSLIAEVPFSAIQVLAQSRQVKKIWCDNQIRALPDENRR